MSHGTPFTVGQFATLASRIITALPRALELCRIDDPNLGIKAALRYTENSGERTALALSAMFQMLYCGSAALAPKLVFSSRQKIQQSHTGGSAIAFTVLEPSTSWTLPKFVTALLDVPAFSLKDEALRLLLQRGHVLSNDETQALFHDPQFESTVDLGGRFYFFRFDAELGMIDAWSFLPGDPQMVRVSNWSEELGPEHRIMVRNFNPSVGQIRPPV